MEKTEVLERLEPVMNTQVRDVEHTPDTRVVVTPEMVTLHPGKRQRTLEVAPSGVQSLANFVGLPWTIAAKIQPRTFGDVTTQLLDQKRVYSLVVKDGAVTSVVKKGHFHPVSVERALRSIEMGVPSIEFHRVLILENGVISLEVVGEKRVPLFKGELIRAGAKITFSPMGIVDPVVQSYALTLTCTNGATHNHVLREYHYGDGGGGGEGDNIWQWFRNSTREAYNALDRIVKRYREMLKDEIRPEDRASILEAMLHEAQIKGKIADTIRAMALERPPRNSYDMMNLITYASSHLIEAPPKVRRAQEAATQYAAEDTHARVCPVCHTRRN